LIKQKTKLGVKTDLFSTANDALIV